MSGYAGQAIRLPFDSLSEDPAADPIWVVIKNPKLQPPQALRPTDPAAYDTGDDGKMKDADRASEAGREMAARLVIAWRAYDATTSPEFDALTGEQVAGTGQKLLAAPAGGNGAHPDQFAKLPQVIQMAIMEKIAEAVNPPSGPGAPTQKTSSGPLNPSTTAPGPAGPAPRS